MPANHHVDNNAQLIITTWEGEAYDIEFIGAIKKYQKDIQNHPDYINKWGQNTLFSNILN